MDGEILIGSLFLVFGLFSITFGLVKIADALKNEQPKEDVAKNLFGQIKPAEIIKREDIIKEALGE